MWFESESLIKSKRVKIIRYSKSYSGKSTYNNNYSTNFIRVIEFNFTNDIVFVNIPESKLQLINYNYLLL